MVCQTLPTAILFIYITQCTHVHVHSNSCCANFINQMAYIYEPHTEYIRFFRILQCCEIILFNDMWRKFSIIFFRLEQKKKSLQKKLPMVVNWSDDKCPIYQTILRSACEKQRTRTLHSIRNEVIAIKYLSLSRKRYAGIMLQNRDIVVHVFRPGSTGV